ncbi:uncharacterized protein AAG666_000966 isoform 1-T8 [Megaptera novaeangliae]
MGIGEMEGSEAGARRVYPSPFLPDPRVRLERCASPAAVREPEGEGGRHCPSKTGLVTAESSGHTGQLWGRRGKHPTIACSETDSHGGGGILGLTSGLGGPWTSPQDHTPGPLQDVQSTLWRTGHSWKLGGFDEQPNLMNPAKTELSVATPGIEANCVSASKWG